MQRKSRRFTFFWDRFIVPCSLPHLVFHGFLSLLGDVPISELTDESFQGTIFKLLSYVFPCFFLIFMGHQWFFPNFYGKPMVNREQGHKNVQVAKRHEDWWGPGFWAVCTEKSPVLTYFKRVIYLLPSGKLT